MSDILLCTTNMSDKKRLCNFRMRLYLSARKIIEMYSESVKNSNGKTINMIRLRKLNKYFLLM